MAGSNIRILHAFFVEFLLLFIILEKNVKIFPDHFPSAILGTTKCFSNEKRSTTAVESRKKI